MSSLTKKILIISFTEEKKDGQGTHIYVNLLQNDPLPGVYKKFLEDQKIVLKEWKTDDIKKRFEEALKDFDEINIESCDTFLTLEKTFPINYDFYKKNIDALYKLLLKNTKNEVVFSPLN